MKKVFLAVLAIAAMTSCSNENDVVDSSVSGPVAIQMNAGVGSVNVGVRSAVNPGDAFGAQFVASAQTGDYAATIWDTEAAIAANGAVTLTTPQYYPIDGSVVYMKGFAPAGTATNGTVDYTITGDEDIMVTSEQSGTRTTAGALSFRFDHLLTQLKFKVKAADNTYPAGVTLKELTVAGMQNSASLNLNTGALTFSGATVALDVLKNGAYAINPTGTSITELLMVNPGAAITLDIVINDGTNDIPYTGITVGGLTTVKGSSHLITLTFNTTIVTAEAIVAPWTPGTEGDVEI